MSRERGIRLKFFGALFLFALAISFLWLGLNANFASNSNIFRISGWYIGAVFFATLGVIVLKLPTTTKQN